ncbi:FecR domain-containing protein [Variovorax sp. UMC13]|uniref:FecR family protein n=1 Tax=Variovorax sp. UMC13 TaxID=1862326 RepID=UPI00287BB804|nr:FecR domain-containing protein [Variovorax sp. UMC13]
MHGTRHGQRVNVALELDAATQAAVRWMVALHSGDTTAAERRDFDAWLLASPHHRQAWQQLSGALVGTLAPARGAAADAPGALLGEVLARQDARTRQRRRLLRGALGLGGLAAGAALVAERQLPLAQLTADLRTGTGERRELALPDGSRLTLDARSAVDLDFRAGHRTVTLRQGALIAQAASVRPGEDAPFIVRTVHGTLRALGTGFVVRLDAAHSQVGMLEHSVEIRTAQGRRETLAEGRSARFDARGITFTDEAPAASAAWRRGMLEAHDQTLGEVVDTLRAYRSGFVRITPEAAALRVYGTYALDDTDRALTALGETLPVRIRIFQRGWLVLIERS